MKKIFAVLLMGLFLVPSVSLAQVSIDLSEAELEAFFTGFETDLSEIGSSSDVGSDAGLVPSPGFDDFAFPDFDSQSNGQAQMFAILGQLVESFTNPEEFKEEVNAFKRKVKIFTSVFSLFIILTTTLALTAMFKKQSAHVVKVSIKDFWMSLLWGLVIFFVTPLLSLLLLVSVLGSSLAVMLMMLYMVAFMIAKVVAVLLIGALVFRLFKKSKEYDVNWQTAVIGTLLFVGVGLIPWFGMFVQFFFMLAGFGALCTVLYRQLWLKR